MLDDDSAYGAKYVFGIQTFHVFFPNNKELLEDETKKIRFY